MPELWDAYDKNFKKIEGVTLVRGEKIPDGMYNVVVHIIVKHQDGTFLLMRRDLRKHFGGLLELTAGGALQKGEEPIVGAHRELLEETGIDSNNLRFLKTIRGEEHHSFYTVFYCETNCSKDSITLQEGETIGYVWMTRDEVLKLTEKELCVLRSIDIVKEFNL